MPTGRTCEDAWIAASSLILATERLKFLVALRPGVVSPSQAARQTATFDRLSGGRLLNNVVTGSDPVELAGDGGFLAHAERYANTAEFLTVWRRLLAGDTVDFEGKHICVKGAKLLFPPVQSPYPPLYIGGSSAAAHELAAEQINVYLTSGEPPAAVAQKIADVRQRTTALGRGIRFGIRLHVIVRETNAEAWRAAESLISRLDDATIERAQQAFARSDSEGQRGMAQLHGGSRTALEISPNLWAGVGLVRGGAGAALVGDPETVAARFKEYAALGIDTFVLSGYPHPEEAYQVAERLFPLLPVESRTPKASPALYPSPLGDTGTLEHARSRETID